MNQLENRFRQYLPVNEREIMLGLYVTGVGDKAIPPGKEYKPGGHPGIYSFNWMEGRILPEYQIIYISSGEGSFESETTGLVQFKAPTLIVLFPNMWHSYHPNPATGWHESWITLNGQILYELIALGYLDKKRPLIQHNVPDLSAAFGSIMLKVGELPTENSLILSALALQIIAQIYERQALAPQKEHHADKELVRQARYIIWNYSHHKLTVADVASACGVTVRTLERHFEKNLNTTVREEIVQCRLKRAKLMLIETDLPIKLIAYSLGYSSPEKMSQLFRKWTGQSPTEFRDANAGDAGGTGFAVPAH